MRRVDEYTKAKLTKTVYFPKGKEVCRHCPFCLTDGYNHRREICLLTGSVIACADISIEGDCPLKFKEAKS